MESLIIQGDFNSLFLPCSPTSIRQGAGQRAESITPALSVDLKSLCCYICSLESHRRIIPLAVRGLTSCAEGNGPCRCQIL